MGGEEDVQGMAGLAGKFWAPRKRMGDINIRLGKFWGVEVFEGVSFGFVSAEALMMRFGKP